MTNLYKANGHTDDSVAAQSRTSGGMEFSLFQKVFYDENKWPKSRHLREITVDNLNRGKPIGIVYSQVKVK